MKDYLQKSETTVDMIQNIKKQFGINCVKPFRGQGLAGFSFVPYLLIVCIMMAGQASLRFAWSQVSSAESQHVTGTVTDPSGAVIPRVLVQVRDLEGKAIAHESTNSRGEFAFDLEEGTYLISASMAGFAPLQNQILFVSESTPPLTLVLEIPSLDQEIVVTATKTDTPLAQVGSSTTLLSGEELSREGVSGVAEALRRVAGMALVQSGGAGQTTSLFVRGGDSKHTKVLIDGIAVNEPGGLYNFANMSMTGIEKIEIVRGAQSALYGSDALGGVIQVFTKKGTSEGLSPEPSILIEAGTFSSFRYGGGIEGSDDQMDYALSFSRYDTDNDVLNGSFNEATISANLGFRPSEKTEIRAIFRSEAGRAGVPGQWAFHPPDSDEYYRHRDVAGSLTFTITPTNYWTQKISYTVSDSRQLSADFGYSGSFDYIYEYLNDTRRQKISTQSDLTLPWGHLFTLGGEYERESGTVGDPQGELLKAKRDNFSGFLQDQWSLNNKLYTAAGIQLGINDSFGFFATPRFSLAFLANQPAPGGFWGLTKLKANFGIGIKEPGLLESFSNSPYFKGNPDLLPEKVLSFDAGLEQTLMDGGTVLEAVYFENRFRNQIEYELLDYTTFAGTFFNLGKSRARGLETTLRQKLILGFEISGAYTFLDSEVLESSNSSDPAFAKGQGLFRRPRHSGYVDLHWEQGRWTLGATGIFVGSRADSDFLGLGFTRNKGYSILNLLASYKLVEGISAFISVNNATNERYMEVLGYPALRANFRVGLRAGN